MLTQKIVFFVGPDMTGKTNIAKAYSRASRIPYYKCSTEHDAFINKQDRFINDLRYGVTHLLDVLTQTGYSLIFDRGYPCEWVYSQYFNRQTDFDLLTKIDKKYADLGATIIVCSRSSYVGIKDDLDNSIDAAALKKIDSLYREFIKITDCKGVILNVDDENLSRQIRDIKIYIGD